MIKSFEPGFFQDIPFHEYLADPAINSSGLKLFSQSPAKFKFWKNNDRPGTPSQILGSATHCLILEPEHFTKRFGKEPAPRIGTPARIKWDRCNSTAIALTPRQWDDVHSMAEAFKTTSCSVARELLSGGNPEMSIFWDDPGTGLRAKIRPDYLRNDDIIIDIKTAQDASPRGFLRAARKWGYQYQSAFYQKGLDCAYRAAGVNRQTQGFIFIVLENFPPYEIAIYTLSENILELARQQIDETLVRYAQCLKNDKWPGYINEIVILEEKNHETINTKRTC